MAVCQQLLAEREEVLGKRLQGEVLANLSKFLRKVKKVGGGTVLKTFCIFQDKREWNILKEGVQGRTLKLKHGFYGRFKSNTFINSTVEKLLKVIKVNKQGNTSSVVSLPFSFGKVCERVTIKVQGKFVNSLGKEVFLLAQGKRAKNNAPLRANIRPLIRATQKAF